MKTFSISPGKLLLPYIDRYWGWESLSSEIICLPKVLPGTGVELIFHYCGTPFQGEHRSRFLTTPVCHIAHLRTSYYQLQPAKNVGFLAVRFRSGAFRHFCPYSATELLDTFISAEDLWGNVGSEFAVSVLDASNLRQRIALIEQYLTAFLLRFQRKEARIDYAIQRMYYEYHVLQLQNIITELQISPRHFQRLIHEALGMSPKSFCRLARFQKTTRELLLRKETDYLGIALDYGYYDQAHFIKDFKNFAQETPSSFLQKKNFMSHFYNTKLSFSANETLHANMRTR
jgi:AraC-like DNA-binding protein